MNAVAESSNLDVIAGTVATTLKIPVNRLDVDASFDSFGMDSIIAIELMTNLSKQLSISITPAQLTAVNSIRELAEAINSSMVAPSAKAQPIVVAQPMLSPVRSEPRNDVDQATTRRRQTVQSEGVGSLSAILRFVRNEYGIDISGERFTTKDALIDYLIEHHTDALSHYYGLNSDTEILSTPVAPSPASTSKPSQDIAIIGMACQFADAKTPKLLWKNLIDGRSSIEALPTDRWRDSGDSRTARSPRWGALIDDVDLFDASFFGLTDEEAILHDPQERVVTQSLYHALQNAGIRADKLRGSRTGLFLGYEYSEYEHYLRNNLHRMPVAPVFSSSSPIYYLANRISFLYDFNGPSEVINASCASSALAIHRACQSLAQGECDIAICGGVSLNLFPDDYAAIAHYGLLSPNGTCAVFDDNANGFTRGEGLGLLVLKRLHDAERDNSRIYAKVVATHQNNRGRASFISEIKHESITQVIRECYEKHSISRDSMHYIEVDGYATKWGDSFEFEGIKNAIQVDTAIGKTCALGSIKGNIGHVEPASGVASAIKLSLSMHHRVFPATITKSKISSFIDVESQSNPLYIADRLLTFDDIRRNDEPIRAGINSFSDSGVNVHIVLEEYAPTSNLPRATLATPLVFIFSAKTLESLRQYLDTYSDYLSGAESAIALDDLAYTQHLVTEPMEYRLALVAASHGELSQLLSRAKKSLAEGKPIDGNGPIYIGNVLQRDSRKLLDVITAQISEEKLLENLREGLLREIALLWTSGIDIPWEAYWHAVNLERGHNSQASTHILDIPQYPFAKKRYWLDLEPAEFDERFKPSSSSEIASQTSFKKKKEDIVREWRFVSELDGEELAEALDAEEKIRLFVTQETSVLLGIAPDSIDENENFLRIGFDSIAMATLIQQLINLLGDNISPSIVFNFPDINSLSRHLADRYSDKVSKVHAVRHGFFQQSEESVSARSTRRTISKKSDLETWFVDRETVSSGLLVPMQTNATGTPIFAVPGADGSVLSLQTLSKALDGIRPMFAFQAVGLDGAHEPLNSVSAIADANIEALAAMRDRRRVNLLGHSNGAIVAFEMARKLLKKNVTVERLVLLDCRCPALAFRNEMDEISDAFVNVIQALGGQQQLNVSEFKDVPETDRANYLYRLVRDNGFEMPHEHFMLAYRLALANENACRAYRPEKITKACKTIVVRATQSNGESPADLGWNKFLTKPAFCVELDADHLSVLGKESSAQIARLFH